MRSECGAKAKLARQRLLRRLQDESIFRPSYLVDLDETVADAAMQTCCASSKTKAGLEHYLAEQALDARPASRSKHGGRSWGIPNTPTAVPSTNLTMAVTASTGSRERTSVI